MTLEENRDSARKVVVELEQALAHRNGPEELNGYRKKRARGHSGH